MGKELLGLPHGAYERRGVGLGKKWIRREKRGGSVRDKDELDEQGRTVCP